MNTCILAFLLSAVAATAAEFHVAPTGADVLIKARDEARKVTGPNTIVLAPGRYFHHGTMVLDDRDTGLTIKGAQPGAMAEVYGGVPVTGWEQWKGNIWRAPVPKGKRFFNLIVDGQPATMAQTPNAGSGFGGGAWIINNGAVGVPQEWRGYDYSDAQVFGFLGANWFSEMREVTAVSPNAEGVLPIDGGSAQFGGMNHRFFIRGVLEFLDEPGEWCLKHKEGFVYYWPEDRRARRPPDRAPHQREALRHHGTFVSDTGQEHHHRKPFADRFGFLSRAGICSVSRRTPRRRRRCSKAWCSAKMSSD